MPVVVAVIPGSKILDEEANAARKVGLPVLRFSFLDSLEIIESDSFQEDVDGKIATEESPELSDTSATKIGIHRGFMLSGERYALLYSQFLQNHGIRLHVSPAGYELVHYYPNAYPFIKDFSPRSCWCPLPLPAEEHEEGEEREKGDLREKQKNSSFVTRDTLAKATKNLSSAAFEPFVRENIQQEWRKTHHQQSEGAQQHLAQHREEISADSKATITHVMLKDYVKSAKPHFLKVPIEPEFPGSSSLAQHAVDFVHERGISFNRGVVFKEHVPMPERESSRAEWRLWFIGGKLHSVNFNSEGDLHGATPRVPQRFLEAAEEAATKLAHHFPQLSKETGVFQESGEEQDRSDDDDDVPSSRGNTFVTIDFAVARDGHWFCLEAGDGGVSGPAVVQDIKLLWSGLKQFFSGERTSAVGETSGNP